jgi:hypothetical protein
MAEVHTPKSRAISASEIPYSRLKFQSNRLGFLPPERDRRPAAEHQGTKIPGEMVVKR